jgi:hypothetical protein
MQRLSGARIRLLPYCYIFSHKKEIRNKKKSRFGTPAIVPIFISLDFPRLTGYTGGYEESAADCR